MAQHEVVELVEELLADHRSALRSGSGLENLERLLNIFAEVGWPESIELVWRLDEVFRWAGESALRPFRRCGASAPRHC